MSSRFSRGFPEWVATNMRRSPVLNLPRIQTRPHPTNPPRTRKSARWRIGHARVVMAEMAEAARWPRFQASLASAVDTSGSRSMRSPTADATAVSCSRLRAISILERDRSFRTTTAGFPPRCGRAIRPINLERQSPRTEFRHAKCHSASSVTDQPTHHETAPILAWRASTRAICFGSCDCSRKAAAAAP